MALGSTTPQRKVYYLGIKLSRKTTREGKEVNLCEPHITVQTRDYSKPGEPIVSLKEEKEVSGYLMKIYHGYYEHKGKKVQKIGMVLVDQEDEYRVEMNLNNTSARGLINKMVSIVDEIGWITIRTYVQRSKDGREPMAGVYLTNNFNKVPWKYQYKRTEETEPDDVVLADLVDEQADPQDPSKKQKIYHRLNAFLIKDWEEHARIVEMNAKNMGLDLRVPPPPPGRPAAAAPARQGQTEQGPGTEHQIPDADQAPPPGKEDDHQPDLGGDSTDDLPF